MAAPAQLVVKAYDKNVIHIRDREGSLESFCMPWASNRGPTWISPRSARELERLKNELNPGMTTGSHMILSRGDKSEEEVVHILENYGFRIVNRGLDNDKGWMVTEMEK